MKIVGYQGVSLIDFPGKISTVLFSVGCNFACPFCQNPELIHPTSHQQPASYSEIQELLSSRQGFIDGVVVTGGEPTVSPDLKDFLSKIKSMGLATKLDTNGYLPKVLAELLDEKLVDFVAMDIKTSLEKYDSAAGCHVEIERIEQSIDLLLGSKIGSEFRTTVVPGFVDQEDIEKITKRISGAKSFRLQQFSNHATLDPDLARIKPHTPDVLEKMVQIAQHHVDDVKTRGI